MDGDTTDCFPAVRAFVEDSGLCEVQITVATPFPGTPLYARLLGEGRLLDSAAWEKCTLFDVNFQPSRMSVEDLEQGLVELASQLYTAEAKTGRRNAFRDHVRSARQPRREEAAACMAVAA